MAEDGRDDQEAPKAAVDDKHQEEVGCARLEDGEADSAEDHQAEADVKEHDGLVARFVEEDAPEEPRKAVPDGPSCPYHRQKLVVLYLLLHIGLVVAGDQKHAASCQDQQQYFLPEDPRAYPVFDRLGLVLLNLDHLVTLSILDVVAHHGDHHRGSQAPDYQV